MPLRWGEVIPLWFMQSRLVKLLTRTLIMSQPSRRNVDGQAMIPELLRVGSQIYSFLDALPERVIVVISSDLAHTHSADGPYGFSPSAAPFDIACGKWASTLDAEPLLETAGSLLKDALSCGYTGMVMLHGMIRSSGVAWQPRLYANFYPTYYGMLVATFLPPKQE